MFTKTSALNHLPLKVNCVERYEQECNILNGRSPGSVKEKRHLHPSNIHRYENLLDNDSTVLNNIASKIRQVGVSLCVSTRTQLQRTYPTS